MADLPFLDKLDDNQLKVADKIITRAEKMGINPRLALSLAYVESGLRMEKTGDAGEIGIMQVKPATGKLLGYDLKTLRNEDNNIDAGLTYLKQGIDRYKDPMLGVVAYNAGHDAPFLLGDAKEPPKKTLDYVNKINGFGGFEAFTQPTSEVAQEAVKTPDVVSDLIKLSQISSSVPTDSADYSRSLQAAEIGAGLGLVGGVTSPRMFGGSPSSAMTPVEKWTAAMGYNQRGADTMAQAHQAELGTRRGATIRNPLTGEARTPTFRVNKPPVIEVSPLQKATNIGGALLNSPPVRGALAGAGVAGLGQEALSRVNAGDTLGAGIAGVGAAGSALSLVPHPMTRAVGTGLGLASPAALMVLDKMRRESQTPQPPPTSQELETAGKPYFGTARP